MTVTPTITVSANNVYWMAGLSNGNTHTAYTPSAVISNALLAEALQSPHTPGRMACDLGCSYQGSGPTVRGRPVAGQP